MNIVTYKNNYPLGVGDLWDEVFNWSKPHNSGEISPRTNVSDHGNHFKVEMELPGFDKKDIDVTIENNVLKVKAERKGSTEKDKTKYYIHEIDYGVYQREFRLDDTVDGQNIKATYNNGMLALELQKSKAQPDKKITIQ